MFVFNKAQSGRTMMEMLGVLAIVGLLSAGGIAGYSFAMQKYKTNVLIDKVHTMAQQARSLYKKGDYTDFKIADLTDIKKIPDNENPFGGKLLSSDTGDNQIFNIYTQQYNVPPEACVSILRTNWGDKGVFYAVSVNSTLFYDTPVAAGEAANACAGGNKRMVWYLK